jgi:hypothetical protein
MLFVLFLDQFAFGAGLTKTVEVCKDGKCRMEITADPAADPLVDKALSILANLKLLRSKLPNQQLAVSTATSVLHDSQEAVKDTNAAILRALTELEATMTAISATTQGKAQIQPQKANTPQSQITQDLQAIQENIKKSWGMNPPAVVPQIEVIEIAGSQCPACDRSAPALDAARQKGMQAVRVNVDTTAGAAGKYGLPTGTVNVPLWILRVNGAEVSRCAGELSPEGLLEWVRDNQQRDKAVRDAGQQQPL